MSVNGIEIEVGQLWKTRDRGVAEVVGKTTGSWPWQVQAVGKSGYRWTVSDRGLADIMHSVGKTDPRDLVQLLEVTPTPEPEPIPAPVAIEQMDLSLSAPEPTEMSKQPPSALGAQVAGDHYKGLKIQPVEYAHANSMPFIEGSVVKYITRWRDKGGIKDLEKARHFIDMLIELENRK